MRASDVDRLRECRAFGTLAGMATAGIAFWGQFSVEIFRVIWQMTSATWQMRSPEYDLLTSLEYSLVRGFLVLGVFAFALGASGVAGRWAGEHIIYPVRTGDNATVMKMLTRLMIVGAVVAVLAAAAAALMGALLSSGVFPYQYQGLQYQGLP